MRNARDWRPTKFVYRAGRLRATRDASECAVASRLAADLVARLYQEHIPRFARGRLLDLGCGKVPLYECYRSVVSQNVCVDWEQTLHKNPHVDHEVDLREPLPFGDGEFATVLLSDVLEHLPEPLALWQEMQRVLEAGGRVLMNVPFLYWLHETPHDYYRYTEYALRRFAERTGFTVVVLTPVGGAPEVLTDIAAKLVQHVPLIGKSLAGGLQALTWTAVSSGPLKRLSERSAERFPIGYFMVAEKRP